MEKWNELRSNLYREPQPAELQKPQWKIVPGAELSKRRTESIVDGLWRKEEVLLLGGHSKSWKSWAQIDLLYCIANGLPWLGWEHVTQGKVLCIDMELFEDEIDRRLTDIQDSYGCGNRDNFDVISLRGLHFSLADFSDLAERIDSGTYSAISFDPTYRLLASQGMNESDPATIINLMNRSLNIGSKLKAGLALLQHFSKGNQSEKRALEAFSGSGVWGRAPDACLAFREHDDEKCFTVSADLRHWPRIEPFVVEFVYPRFQVQQDKDPDNLKRSKPGRPQAFSVEALCNLIESDEYISYSSLIRRASAPKRTVTRRLKEATLCGWLASNPTDATYFLTSYYVQKFRNHANNSD